MSINWREIRPSISRGTGIRSDAPNSTGGSVAEVVRFLSIYANTASINNRIRNELAAAEPFATSQLEGCAMSDGVLAVAFITSDSFGEMSASQFRYLSLVGPAYHFPDIFHALRRFHSESRLEQGASTSTYRFFWGIR
jgi:hypothetical protein